MEHTVLADYGHAYKITLGEHTVLAQARTAERPCVGDQVRIETQHEHVWITEVLPRRTVLRRKTAGTVVAEQILAANFDVVCIFFPASKPLNLSYLERLVIAAWDSGARPCILISKSDLASTEYPVQKLKQTFSGVHVQAISTRTAQGIAELLQWIGPQQTALLIGASGVGKSSYINFFKPDTLATQAVRSDQKGRHTTTHRELIRTQTICLIDTPGIREFGLADAENGIVQLYHDVESLGMQCRFPDCRHETEPGCAVRQAIEDGVLASERLQEYRKYLREARHFALKKKQKELKNSKRKRH